MAEQERRIDKQDRKLEEQVEYRLKLSFSSYKVTQVRGIFLPNMFHSLRMFISSLL